MVLSRVVSGCLLMGSNSFCQCHVMSLSVRVTLTDTVVTEAVTL